jgi:hypothetical protein
MSCAMTHGLAGSCARTTTAGHELWAVRLQADAQILAMFRTIHHYAFKGYAAERAAELGIRYAA